MARATRNSRLESRTARSKLKPSHEPYWISIGRTLHLGYRKGINGGSWIGRFYKNNKYKKIKLGQADDYLDANNKNVFDYFQAQEKARIFADEVEKYPHQEMRQSIITVEDAAKNYLDWYQTHRKAFGRTKNTIETHIILTLGKLKLTELTPVIIRRWHEELAKKAPKLRSTALKANYAKIDNSSDVMRKRKATANRILTVLKAALNHAWRDGYVSTDDAWRRVKPFHNVDAPKIRYLTIKECERLINACESDFRNAVKAALLTGCRYGELTHLQVYDFDAERNALHIKETKNGKARYVPLTDEGVRLFNELIRGKSGNDLILVRYDGKMWGDSHQIRRLAYACEIAKIYPAISFHVLRHTYGSLLASKGVSLQVIAELLGHSDTRVTSKHYAHLLPSYVSDTLRANLPQFTEIEKDNVINL